MAEIPVERKGTPWWIWVLVAVVVIGFLIWIFSPSPRVDRDLVVAPIAPVGLPAAAGDPVRDLVYIVTVPDRRPLVGRTVVINNARVLDVVGDRGFWIGTSPAQRLFVMREEVPGQPPTDAELNINPGQIVSLSGVIRAMPDAPTATTLFGEEGAAAARDEQIYLFARMAEVQQPASVVPPATNTMSTGSSANTM